MRLVMAMLAAGILAGCVRFDAPESIQVGTTHVEPHPVYADSVRIVTGLEGSRQVAAALLGDECAGAEVVEEGRVRRRGGWVDVALRVVCPAARLR